MLHQYVQETGVGIFVEKRQSMELVIFPLGNLMQPAIRPSRHTNSRAYATLTANKDCYKHSFLPKTINDWNSLPGSIFTIIDINLFKEATEAYLTTKQD